MGALMELILVQKQVLIHLEGVEEKAREVNALFGISAALSLINCMIGNTSSQFFCSTDNFSVNERVHELIDDHQLWLETKPLNELPVFINAQFYELIEMVHSLPLQINMF